MVNNKYPGQIAFYSGKVRDLYTVGDVIVAEVTNRISAFDKILPYEIPYKGAVLNLIAAHFLDATKDIVPNCMLAVPTSNTQIWRKFTPFKIEVVVRAYNTGSFFRNYIKDTKELPWIDYKQLLKCKENEKFPYLIVTPTTKEAEGHDVDISGEAIVNRGFASQKEWKDIRRISLELFRRGQEMADAKGLILVDTKYEFGKDDQGHIFLIDEIHTPDSSRYWYKDGYEKAFKGG